ncbi:hypothetical protein V8B55DRAFT_1586411 [Mucor lusitanicus]|uniref:Uncharacterized protein n=2 Tax=Mucor circinelloides f. lusitanicus TaxID=29924 RepID=A0A168MSE2_MUCCL|nr:hypothetical protein FB192DRAFT_1467826 [Mucor lusitanicus]OAD05304.1 hypothetical protein MUCCIDRAFT_161999 [Mucor lusitanicus CBS 277.49]
MSCYKTFFKQNIVAKLLLISLVAASLCADAASIAPRRFDGMVAHSTEGFYDETNNRPLNTAVPTFEMPPLVHSDLEAKTLVPGCLPKITIYGNPNPNPNPDYLKNLFFNGSYIQSSRYNK